MSNNIVDAEQWLEKGYVYAILQKYGDAIECFDKAIEIGPKEVIGWNGKGAALDSLGRYQDDGY
jgi:tetratricopeptide (TPR) repeat protein